MVRTRHGDPQHRHQLLRKPPSVYVIPAACGVTHTGGRTHAGKVTDTK